jgi:hypothetical protein
VRSQPTLATHGMYWQNIQEYVHLFPSDQLLVVFLEDFSNDPDYELKRCYRYLSVTESVKLNSIHKPRNESSKYRRDGTVAGLLRKVQLVHIVKEWIPEDIKAMIKKSLTKKESYVIDWDPVLKKELIQEFKKDAEQFLTAFGKPVDYWNLVD